MLDMTKKWMPVAWAEESGQIRAAVGPLIERRIFERRIFIHRQQFPSRHDKSIRAQAIRGRMAMDGLRVPTSAPWYAAFQQELLNFPVGKHDDMVDALSLIGQMLTTLLAGREPKKASLGFEPEIDKYQPMEFVTDYSFKLL
jgi:predicted phage terminase large subunit-like protein